MLKLIHSDHTGFNVGRHQSETFTEYVTLYANKVMLNLW